MTGSNGHHQLELAPPCPRDTCTRLCDAETCECEPCNCPACLTRTARALSHPDTRPHTESHGL